MSQQKNRPTKKRVTVIYWTCLTDGHVHMTKDVAARCIRKTEGRLGGTPPYRWDYIALRAQVQAGFNVKKIAELSGKSPSSVRSALRNLQMRRGMPDAFYGVTEKTKSSLIAEGIFTLHDALSMTDAELLAIPNFGPASLCEIRNEQWNRAREEMGRKKLVLLSKMSIKDGRLSEQQMKEIEAVSADTI